LLAAKTKRNIFNPILEGPFFHKFHYIFI
jgi:hypothetical protein